MKKSILLMAVCLFLLPTEGKSQKWLRQLEGVAKTVGSVLDSSTSGTTTESSLSGTAGTSQQGATKIETHHPDLKIKITRCVVSGKTCVIDMVVTNTNSKDVNVTFNGGHWGSLAFDDEGNRYGGNAFLIGINDLTGYEIEGLLLPSNVPLKMKMHVEGVPESATQFSRINLASRCSVLNLESGKPIIISNLPIGRNTGE